MRCWRAISAAAASGLGGRRGSASVASMSPSAGPTAAGRR